MQKCQQLLLLICCGLLSFDTCGDEQEKRSQLEALKSQIAKLTQSLVSRTSEIDKFEEQLKDKELAARELRLRTQHLEKEISTLEKELGTLSSRRTELEQLSLNQQAMISREINAAYRLGSSEPIKLLLNQDDPYKLARLVKYYQYFTNARREKIHQFKKTITELESVEREITRKQETLLQSREENAIRLAELNLEQERRQKIINDLNKLLADDNAQLNKLKDERKRLEELIARIEEELHDLAPETSEAFHKLKGKLPWPTTGALSHSYGSTRTQNMKWTGWLIDTTAGNPVSAVHHGRVVFSDYFRGHGLMVIIDHGNGYLSLYAHNQLLLKEVGDWVRPGDTIAQSGSTGGLSKSALYFEIRHNGKPQDPKRWLKTH